MFTSPHALCTVTGCAGVWHFHQYCVDHRQVGGDWVAVFEGARIIQKRPFGIVDGTPVQRLADALHHAALDLGPRRSWGGSPGRHPVRQRTAGSSLCRFSASTSRSQNWVEKPGAWPPALTDAAAVIGPPVCRRSPRRLAPSETMARTRPRCPAGRLGVALALPDHAASGSTSQIRRGLVCTGPRSHSSSRSPPSCWSRTSRANRRSRGCS